MAAAIAGRIVGRDARPHPDPVIRTWTSEPSIGEAEDGPARGHEIVQLGGDGEERFLLVERDEQDVGRSQEMRQVRVRLERKEGHVRQPAALGLGLEVLGL